MPWFQSSKDKQFRVLIEQKMKICLTKPDRYNESFQVLDTLVKKSNQKAIEMIVDHIKQVIKDDDIEPMEKYQAILLLSDLMESHNKNMGKYVSKKILKRLTVLAQHRKNSKDEDRGKDIFPKTKKSQQVYGIKFLNTLLEALADWGTKWPRAADGPYQDFHSAYNDLLMEKGVQFPIQKKSRQSLTKNARNSKQQSVSPQPKIALRGQMVQNPPMKPSIKARQPISKEVSQHFSRIVENLGLFGSFLTENPEFNDMWPVIKSVIEEMKVAMREGNDILAKMIEQGDENSQIFQKIQSYSDFIIELEKDVGVVDRSNEKYVKFNSKHLRRSKKLIATLSVHLEGSNKGSSGNNLNNGSRSLTPVETSLKQKVEQIQNFNKPIIKESNRYDSTSNLQKQLQLNLHQIKKQDFNSNNHNSDSSRHTGNGNFDKVKYAGGNFNKQTVKFEQQNSKEPSESSPQKKQGIIRTPISKITQKNEQQSESQIQGQQNEKNEKSETRNLDKQRKLIKSEKKQNSFSDFEVPVKDNEDSNDNFFKELEKKQNDNQLPMPNKRRNRLAPLQKKKQNQQNFFDISVKSKVESENLSAFTHTKSGENKQDSEISNQKLGFDTFKSPNEISKTINELKQSQKQLGKQKSQILEGEREIVEFQNPFVSNLNDSMKAENPFDTNLNNSGKVIENPFATTVKEPWKSNPSVSSESKSKSSNPFSQKQTPSNKSSVKSIPNRKNSEISNPFDERSVSNKNGDVSADNPFDKETDHPENPFETSKISNPFQKSGKDLFQSKTPFSDKSISKHGSFVDVKKLEGLNRNISMENPFDQKGDPMRQSGPKFVQIEKNKQQDIRNSLLFQPQDVRKSANESVKNFDFDDFMNVSEKRSSAEYQQNESKNNRPNRQSINKSRKSGVNFDDFDDFINNSEKSVSRQQFQSPEFFRNSLQKQKQKSKEVSDFFNQSQDKKNETNFFNQSQSKNNERKSKNSQQVQVSVSKERNSKKLQFNFDDFENYSNSNRSKTEGREKSKESFRFSDFDNEQKSGIKGESLNRDSWNRESMNKESLNREHEAQQAQPISQSHVEWDKFGNISEKESHPNVDQSRYEESEDGNQPQFAVKSGEHPWLNNQGNLSNANQYDKIYENAPISTIRHNHQQNFINEQKSLSINFEQVSPFQKKEIKWDASLSPPSTARYNIFPETLVNIKNQVQQYKKINQQKHRRYNEAKTALETLKAKNQQHLQRIVEAREQKRQFNHILCRIKESNDVKEKDNEELIKKVQKADELKKRILAKERQLYDLLKLDKQIQERRVSENGTILNKYEKFNHNLQKLRQASANCARGYPSQSFASSRAY